MRQHEGCLVRDVGERAVGGQPHGLGAAGVADMVGPERPARAGLAVVEGRPNAHGDARQPSERLDAPIQLRGMERLEAVKPRREVGDAHGVAAGVLERGLQHRGVAHIARDRDRLAVEQDVAEALLLVAGEQAREHRVAVEAREAPPTRCARARRPAPRCGHCRSGRDRAVRCGAAYGARHRQLLVKGSVYRHPNGEERERGRPPFCFLESTNASRRHAVQHPDEPRFEFRAFRDDVAPAARGHAGAASRVEQATSTEVYLVTRLNIDAIVKLREGNLDVKEPVPRQGLLEQWRRALNVEPPVPGDVFKAEVASRLGFAPHPPRRVRARRGRHPRHRAHRACAAGRGADQGPDRLPYRPRAGPRRWTSPSAASGSRLRRLMRSRRRRRLPHARCAGDVLYVGKARNLRSARLQLRAPQRCTPTASRA